MTEPRRVTFAVFRGTLTTWDALFGQAADFASSLPEGALIGISHSADRSEGVVTVWQWTPEPEPSGPLSGRATNS
jgi:hypothetical protein